MKELPWLAEARKHISLKEIPGAKHKWVKKTAGKFVDKD